MKKASGQNNCYSKYVFFERSQNNNFKEKTSSDEKVAEWDPFKYLEASFSPHVCSSYFLRVIPFYYINITDESLNTSLLLNYLISLNQVNIECGTN